MSLLLRLVLTDRKIARVLVNIRLVPTFMSNLKMTSVGKDFKEILILRGITTAFLLDDSIKIQNHLRKSRRVL